MGAIVRAVAARNVHQGGTRRQSAPAVAAVAALVAGLLSACSHGGTTSGGPLPPAPVWSAAAGATPQRPASCAPLPRSAAPRAAQAANLTGTFPWTGTSASAAHALSSTRLHTPAASPPVRPANWGAEGNDWKLTSDRNASATAVSSNPQELCGVEGMSVDRAWQTTTGRPEVVIAVLDSGIEWCNPGIVDKIALNRAALPPPESATGHRATGADPYDLDDSGILNVAQYAADPRVAATAAAYGGYFCATPAAGGEGFGYTGISPEDLIRTFARPALPGGAPNPYLLHNEGPAGYIEAIAGWDVLDDTNDPYDSVHYDHGTGEALDMAGTANTLTQEVGACPNCMILPVRVGDSFISTANAFALGVMFAVDSGATVVSEALGTVNETSTAQEAIDYANAHGVPVIASAADEESEHQNLPAALEHTIVVNSITRETGWSPPSYLYLNGCTNWGAQIAVSVESTSCSSEATGKTAGITGLAESAALDAANAGVLRPYPGLTGVGGRPVVLSANEIRQLITMTADDVDFADAAPKATPPAPAGNDKVNATGVPLATTTRYPTTAGFDPYTGYGRIDAARLVQWIAEGRIPPEAEIDTPSWFATFAPGGGDLVVTGKVAAVRAKSYRYQVDVAAGVNPPASAWRLAAEGQGTHPIDGVLASVPLSQIAALFPGGAGALGGGPVDAQGNSDTDRFTFTIRVLVMDDKGNVGMARRADFLHADAGLVSGFPKQLDSSLDAPVRLAPLGPGGTNVLLVAASGGTIHAYLPDGSELPGWPVRTNLYPLHGAEPALADHAIADRPHGEILGGIAVGDLADAAGNAPDRLDVVAADTNGYVYAWDARGRMLPGWPVHTDPAYSGPNVATDAQNRVLRGVAAAPALGDLEGGGRLDVVVAAMDRHVYAWGPDGKAVPGWPVLVIDTTKVSAIDPVTNHVTFQPGADPMQGTKLIDTPAIGCLVPQKGTGPCRPEVVVGSNEEYREPMHADLGTLGTLLSAAGQLLQTGNARVYAIWPDGELHGATMDRPAGTLSEYAAPFVPGWPAAIADLDPGLLPEVGDGVGGSPVLADLAHDANLEVVVASTVGPLYELNADGSSYLGTGAGGEPKVVASAPPSGSGAPLSALLGTSVPALGSPIAYAPGPGAAPDVAAPAGSLGRLLDALEPADQSPHESEIDVWTAQSGAFAGGFPQPMNDLQFFDQPVAADIAGPAAGPAVVEASGLYDLRAYDEHGHEVAGFPKFTGGWMVGSPAFGPWGKLDDQVLAAGTRSGELLVWTTSTTACASSGSWPQVHHDLWNTQDLSAAAAPAGRCVARKAG